MRRFRCICVECDCLVRTNTGGLCDFCLENKHSLRVLTNGDHRGSLENSSSGSSPHCDSEENQHHSSSSESTDTVPSVTSSTPLIEYVGLRAPRNQLYLASHLSSSEHGRYNFTRNSLSINSEYGSLALRSPGGDNLAVASGDYHDRLLANGDVSVVGSRSRRSQSPSETFSFNSDDSALFTVVTDPERQNVSAEVEHLPVNVVREHGVNEVDLNGGGSNHHVDRRHMISTDSACPDDSDFADV